MDSIEGVFFDIGDTLVRRTPAGVHEWRPGPRAMLNALDSRGVRMGVIPNTGNLTREELPFRVPSDFRFERFDRALVLLSSEIGLVRPDVLIFYAALSAAAVACDRCCYGCDDLEASVAAQRTDIYAIPVREAASDFAGLPSVM